MKPGDKLRVLKSFSGPGGSFPGSTPFQDEVVEVTAENINYMEDALRGGLVEYLVRSRNEAPSVLSDNVTIKKRGSKVAFPSGGDTDL